MAKPDRNPLTLLTFRGLQYWWWWIENKGSFNPPYSEITPILEPERRPKGANHHIIVEIVVIWSRQPNKARSNGNIFR